MSECPLFPICGGCAFRELDAKSYCQQKYDNFKAALNGIKQTNITYGEPIFIKDGMRRRATMAFSNIKKQFKLGFNQTKSHEIVDCSYCPLLTEKLNKNLANIRSFLQILCAEPFTVKKGKKFLKQGITGGDILLCEADNGLDITIELPFEPELVHRMIISEQALLYDDIIRISWKTQTNAKPETILEKMSPLIHNGKIDVYIPAGTFLQASKAGEEALIRLVTKYMADKEGKIADLFCGVGTFSYPLAQNKNNKIWALDSSVELLEGFKKSVNRNQLPNITVEARNLFKYPLDEQELKDIDVLVIDPPRAGAAAQVNAIAQCECPPEKIIAVSCNPYTFINDANTLLSGGYILQEVTMVDQFVYSKHTELVALFERRK